MRQDLDEVFLRQVEPEVSENLLGQLSGEKREALSAAYYACASELGDAFFPQIIGNGEPENVAQAIQIIVNDVNEHLLQVRKLMHQDPNSPRSVVGVTINWFDKGGLDRREFKHVKPATDSVDDIADAVLLAYREGLKSKPKTKLREALNLG